MSYILDILTKNLFDQKEWTIDHRALSTSLLANLWIFQNKYLCFNQACTMQLS